MLHPNAFGFGYIQRPCWRRHSYFRSRGVHLLWNYFLLVFMPRKLFLHFLHQPLFLPHPPSFAVVFRLLSYPQPTIN
ncbi:hypothetical protein Hanom_Chr03g00230181 [Helianthus anomalus]